RNAKGIDIHNLLILWIKHNARLRGWQRITLNQNTTAVTTAAQWDWKRHALTVPLEAFVMLKLQQFTFEPTQE
ncbi:hypothetical protein, partial [Vibrio cholerae]|uniref:hypothetical protein n=1 Tax=Vibrio cholerae TaxID=666 RepID=UPI001E4DE317